jgi:predicted protein tyrosine phosphatase
MSIAAQRRVTPSRKQETHERIATAVADIMKDLGATHGGSAEAPGVRQAAARRVKALIALLGRLAPDRGQMVGHAHAPSMASALAGALMLAGAVDDPKLSNALRDAALRHLTPDGA